MKTVLTRTFVLRNDIQIAKGYVDDRFRAYDHGCSYGFLGLGYWVRTPSGGWKLCYRGHLWSRLIDRLFEDDASRAWCAALVLVNLALPHWGTLILPRRQYCNLGRVRRRIRTILSRGCPPDELLSVDPAKDELLAELRWNEEQDNWSAWLEEHIQSANFTVELIQRDTEHVEVRVSCSEPKLELIYVRMLADIEALINPAPANPIRDKATGAKAKAQAGRRTDQLYDDAYQRLVQGEPREEVFAWFKERFIEEHGKAEFDWRSDGLKESFDRAMARRAKKQETT